MKRLAFLLTLLVVWAAFGFGVNRLLDSRKSSLTTTRAAVAPPQETPIFTLPGTIWVSQAGHLYRLRAGQFSDLELPTSKGSWIQPAVAGGDQLLAVARADAFSDVYLIDGANGVVLKQMTSNASKSGRVELNAWSYFPHLTADGASVVFNYDGPKTGDSYEVDLAVWSGPVNGKLETTRWTTPNGYTGGDVAPFPLPGGGLVYANYMLSATQQIVSRIAEVAKPGAKPVFLTAAADDCNDPAVSPDGTAVAVICTSDTQTANLVLVPLVNGVPGVGRVLVQGCLCTAPAWSPDGGGLLYLAPADATGHFQLWWLAHVAAVTPAPPKQVTTHLDLDATSPPAWAA